MSSRADEILNEALPHEGNPLTDDDMKAIKMLEKLVSGKAVSTRKPSAKGEKQLDVFIKDSKPMPFVNDRDMRKLIDAGLSKLGIDKNGNWIVSGWWKF